MKAHSNEQFLGQVCEFLRKEMPHECGKLTDPELSAFVEQAAERAESFGITEPTPVIQFACLCVAAGLNFASGRDVTAYLNEPGLDQETKMQALIDQLDSDVLG
jgi:hypothetical protein